MSESPDPSPKPLPAERLNAQLVFIAPAKRFSYHIAGLFYTVLAALCVVTAILIVIPSYFMARSALVADATQLLRKNRVLRRHLGSPIRVQPTPVSYEKKGEIWQIKMSVSGPLTSTTVSLSIHDKSGLRTILAAEYDGWNLLSGRRK
jgi:hypothetical protein